MSTATFLVLVLAGLTTPAPAAEMTGKELRIRLTRVISCVAVRVSPGSFADDAPGTLQLRRTRGKDHGLPERTNLRADYIESVVRHGLRSMPPFVPSEMSRCKTKTTDTAHEPSLDLAIREES
jgi:hypothetical protein